MNFVIAVATVGTIALLMAWFFSDRTVYIGSASVLPNKMKHEDPRSRTVFVVVPGIEGILLATVTLAKSASLGAMAQRFVTVRQRLFQAPRVTSVG